MRKILALTHFAEVCDAEVERGDVVDEILVKRTPARDPGEIKTFVKKISLEKNSNDIG